VPIQLEIVTPERLVYEDEVDSVNVPGIEGELGILPHHAPLLSILGFGELRIRKGGAEESFAIVGGFVQVRPDKVVVMAETADLAAEIDLEKAQEARREAEHRRRDSETGVSLRPTVTLDSLFGEIHRGDVQDFNIVLKVDVQGSLEPLVRTLEDLGVEEVNVKVIHASVGSINESDVQLASASKGVIIGFNTDPEPGAIRLAEVEGVEGGEFLVTFVDHERRASEARSWRRPRRMRAFTVPRGSASFGAISAWVRPPKNASSRARR
jgi:ATP synthase F1 epsilon subunit